MAEKQSALHTGHRDRMRRRFLESGGKGLADHELLEMLLFYVIPRRDTNDLAHTLIERFGSLSGVLEADAGLLCQVMGVKEGAATYLKLLGEAGRRYTAAKMSVGDQQAIFDTPAKIAAYMMPRYVGVTVERVYMLCFDNKMSLIDCYHVCDGSVGNAAVSIRSIVERAYAKRAAGVILTHNHPDGVAYPSGDDIRLTRRLDEAFRLLEIPLIEHYVFSNHSYVPIMSQCRVGGEEEYAASSLVDVMRKRLSRCNGLEL